MKIAALLLTAVVALNSVDISSQGNSSSNRSNPPSPPRREPPPPRPRYPLLPHGSLIISGFDFPQYIYAQVGHNNFEELVLHYEAVLNYEKKIVGVFLKKTSNELRGLYYGQVGRTRVKLNPACFDEGPEHYEPVNAADLRYYPEFQDFEKPNGIILESIEAYQRLGRGLACSHTPEMRNSLLELPGGAHIVRGFVFPHGFFFKINNAENLYPTLALHRCDVVVDPSKMIVAVFLGRTDYSLHGIYLQEGGERVKLAHPTLESEHFPLTREEKYELYIEFKQYQKPRGMLRGSFAECG